MALNINNLNTANQVKINSEQHTQVKQQVAADSANTKTAHQDSVSLTPQAQKMTELQKKASDAPVVDQKKIEQLKTAIASGDYKIDPEKLAANIANFEFSIN